MLSISLGEEAVGRVLLFIASESNKSSDEDHPMSDPARLQNMKLSTLILYNSETGYMKMSRFSLYS